MDAEIVLLATTALSVGVIHTLLGPDHYLPFVAMARVGAWSRRKTLVVTALCGAGHVAGSVVLGMVGIAFGLSLAGLEAFESSRGSLAAWGLVLFGLLYMIWGFRRARRGRVHAHVHAHADGSLHLHPHDHTAAHLHPHAAPFPVPVPVPVPAPAPVPVPGSLPMGDGLEEDTGPKPEGEETERSVTPWVLFVIFLLGPCEALIPLLMFPAATDGLGALLLVTGFFGVATVGTMLVAVLAGLAGVERLPFRRLERHAHALAGLAILLCGVAIHIGL